jgi:hypothetical protein
MEEYDNETELSVASGEWVIKEANQLIKQYHACKTVHAQNKLRPKLEYMMKRLAFEKREIGKLMGDENEF